MKKKKVLLFALFILISISAKSQYTGQIVGGFGCGDPDAWFDKEIYFAAYHDVSVWDPWYGGLVQQSYNDVVLSVNNEYYYEFTGWQYNTYLIINDIKMDKGDVVSMYINGIYSGCWVCDQKQPTFKDRALKALDKKPHTRPSINVKKLRKVLRKDVPKILKRIK